MALQALDGSGISWRAHPLVAASPAPGTALVTGA